MKRILLGFGVLGGVVLIGSAGLYYAHHHFGAGAAPEATETDLSSVPSARDVVPTPIPLPNHAQDASEPAGNPFARSTAAPRATETQDRYADHANSTLAASPTAAAEEAREIPDADPLSRSPRDVAPAPRYARQAAAELPAGEDEETAAANDAQTETPDRVSQDEPRRLAPLPERQQSARYGRDPEPDRNARHGGRRLSAEVENTAEAPLDSVQEEPAAAPLQRTPREPEAVESDGTGRPGDPQLSGSQAPTLTIEKTAPPEIQIGKPAKFIIKVRNAGSVVAHGVEIHDTVPQGTQLIETAPQAKRGAQGELTWSLGSLKPGEEQTTELQLMPTAEGEIGSVATVHFRAEASVRTVSTRPMLNLEVHAPAKILKGENVMLQVKISNPGTGAATGVVLTEQVPQGLSHPDGKELELEIGTLKPGETREMELALVAAAAGAVTNVISAEAEANLHAEVRTELEVIAPQLQVSMAGPKRRYLERNATHNISVSNPGTAAAKDIELVAVLPREVKFVEANNGGQFDEASHSVYWSLEELPPQETGTVTLTTLPVHAGDARLLIKSTAQAGLKDQREEVVSIEGLAAINFQLSDAADPIEVGGQTSYEVRVTNQGSKAAGNVRLVALVPREMKPLAAEGPVRYKIEAQRVVFEPLKQLAPKAEATFTIKTQALTPGDLRLQIQITTDENRDPITKEESTRVYGDE